jgi:hypothetical protein
MKLIKQYDTKFTNIKFKNSTSLSAYGCCVMSVAMIIKYHLQAYDEHEIVKQVVSECTNSNGDFFYPPEFKINGTKFGCEKMALDKPTPDRPKFDVSAEIDKGNAVVIALETQELKKNMHFVLCNQIGVRGNLDTYKILDPGFGCTTIGELKTNIRFNKNKVKAIDVRRFIVVKR